MTYLRTLRSAGLVLLGAVALIAAVALAFAPIPWRSFGAASYVGLFIANLLSGIIAFAPSPAQGLIISAARVLNPIVVAIVSGTGWAIGELSTYFVGKTLPTDLGRVFNWLLRPANWIVGHPRASHILIYLACIAPLPLFDVVSIVAGQRGISLRRYLAPVVLARLTRAAIYAGIGAHLKLR